MMLIIGPFNGPLTLLLDPASTALSAGNPCILKLAKPSGSSTFANGKICKTKNLRKEWYSDKLI